MKMGHIREVVAAHYGLTVKQICRKHASPKFSHPRQIAMYFCRKLTTASSSQIVRFFGREDPTTVVYAVGAVKKRYSEDALIQLECKITGNFPTFKEIQDRYKEEIKKEGL